MKLFRRDIQARSIATIMLSLCLALLNACAIVNEPESTKVAVVPARAPPANDTAQQAAPKVKPDAKRAAKSDTSPRPGETSEIARERDRTSEVLVYALSLVGVKYQFGGNSAATGFDCSGFVHHVFGEIANVALPRSAEAIAQRGAAVAKDDLTAGDLVFYNTRSRANSHVGIYLGNNTFVHSPSPGKSVEIVDMTENYWRKRFNGAKRLLPATNVASLPVVDTDTSLPVPKTVLVKPNLVKVPDAVPIVNGQ
jgi:cell wall-associated NlpC family hydrolase